MYFRLINAYISFSACMIIRVKVWEMINTSCMYMLFFLVNRESKSRTVYLTYAKTMDTLYPMIDLTSMLMRKPEFIDQY